MYNNEIKIAKITQKLEDAYYIKFENDKQYYYIEFSFLSNCYWSESKEELEALINSKKYNL